MHGKYSRRDVRLLFLYDDSRRVRDMPFNVEDSQKSRYPTGNCTSTLEKRYLFNDERFYENTLRPTKNKDFVGAF